MPSTLSFGKPQKAKMDSENFKKDITEADLPNSPRHHPCYRKGENPQQSRKLNHTLWSTIDIPTTLEPHPFSKPPRTSISGKRRKPLLSSHGSIFPLFLLQIRHHIFLFPIFSASLRSIWQRQEEQVCTQSQWRTCRRRCLRLHPLFSKIPLLLPQKTTVFTRTNRENPVNSDL